MSASSRLANDADRIATARATMLGAWDSSSAWFRGDLRTGVGRTHIEPLAIALAESQRTLSALADTVGSVERMLR